MHRLLGQRLEKDVISAEQIARIHARRSIFASRDLVKGQLVLRDDLVMKRPGTGISPEQLGSLVGKKLRMAVQQDEPLAWNMLEEAEDGVQRGSGAE